MSAPKEARARAALVALGFSCLVVCSPSQARADDEPNKQPAGVARAEPAPATEDQVFAAWLARGRELAALRAKIGAARFDVATAALWPNPSLTLSGDFLVSGTNINGTVGAGPQLTFALPVFGQIGMRKDEAIANLRLAEVEVLAEVWDHAADVEDAMLDRAFSDAEVEGIQMNLSELARIARVVSTRAAAGANSVYDTLRVSSTEATFRAGLATAQTERERAEAKLVSLIAVPGVSEAPVTREGLLAFRGPESESALLSIARQRRPDLALAERGIAAARASAERYRREVTPIPSVSVGPYFSHSPSSVYLQASLSLPLPAFDRNQGLIGKALVQADGQRALSDATQQRIGIEVHGAWQARERAREALTLFREGGLKATSELLQRAEVSYQAGSFAILDLLDAYRAVWDARAQERQLERAFAEAEAELEHAAVLLPINAQPNSAAR